MIDRDCPSQIVNSFKKLIKTDLALSVDKIRTAARHSCHNIGRDDVVCGEFSGKERLLKGWGCSAGNWIR